MIVFKAGLLLAGLALGLDIIVMLEYLTYKMCVVASYLFTMICVVIIPEVVVAFALEVDYSNILCFIVTGMLLVCILGVGYFFVVQALSICGRIYDFIHK